MCQIGFINMFFSYLQNSFQMKLTTFFIYLISSYISVASFHFPKIYQKSFNITSQDFNVKVFDGEEKSNEHENSKERPKQFHKRFVKSGKNGKYPFMDYNEDLAAIRFKDVSGWREWVGPASLEAFLSGFVVFVCFLCSLFLRKCCTKFLGPDKEEIMLESIKTILDQMKEKRKIEDKMQMEQLKQKEYKKETDCQTLKSFISKDNSIFGP